MRSFPSTRDVGAMLSCYMTQRELPSKVKKRVEIYVLKKKVLVKRRVCKSSIINIILHTKNQVMREPKFDVSLNFEIAPATWLSKSKTTDSN